MEPLLVVPKYDDHLKEMITYFFIQNSFKVLRLAIHE